MGGQNFHSLDDEDSIVRIGYGIGQNMFTPGDLTAEIPLEGGQPYAGTLTYSLSWQSFNRYSARNFQITIGVMGEEAFAKEVQKFVHNDMCRADDPKGWDTQRETTPLINIGYRYSFLLARTGQYTNDWGGQLIMDSSASVGNLDTSLELGLELRCGWNILEGFGTTPASPGASFFRLPTFLNRLIHHYIA
jgi:lipid A 3-O-deacylase